MNNFIKNDDYHAKKTFALSNMCKITTNVKITYLPIYDVMFFGAGNHRAKQSSWTKKEGTIMRYIGSKRTVLPFIKATIEETYGNFSNSVVADLFAGTACVGEMFKREGAQVISNDYLSFSYALQIERG